MKNWQIVPVYLIDLLTESGPDSKSQFSSWLKSLENFKINLKYQIWQYKSSKGSWGETAHLFLDGAHFPLAFTHNQCQQIKFTVYPIKKC